MPQIQRQIRNYYLNTIVWNLFCWNVDITCMFRTPLKLFPQFDLMITPSVILLGVSLDLDVYNLGFESVDQIFLLQILISGVIAFTLCVLGLRCVYPYYFTFTTFCKGRWVGRNLIDVFKEEFCSETQEYYVSIEYWMHLF